MIEWILIISMYSNAMGSNVATSVTTIPFAFITQEECNSAGLKAKSNLVEGVSIDKSVSFVCVQRTNAIPKN
jgi:hypothetical protein